MTITPVPSSEWLQRIPRTPARRLMATAACSDFHRVYIRSVETFGAEIAARAFLICMRSDAPGAIGVRAAIIDKIKRARAEGRASPVHDHLLGGAP